MLVKYCPLISRGPLHRDVTPRNIISQLMLRFSGIYYSISDISFCFYYIWKFDWISFRILLLQLREDFDCGKETILEDEQCPHDVATLLKEYLRDLPDPLLCRDLYPAFVQTQSKNSFFEFFTSILNEGIIDHIKSHYMFCFRDTS